MKLLVTTDFSVNSKGAIRFAVNLAKQSKAIDVVFYHGLYILKPTRWTSDFFYLYEKEEKARLMNELEKFVNQVLGKEKVKFASINYIVDYAISVEKDIINYAIKGSFDYICMATQGAGLLRKMMGTHTSAIVNNSHIPVLVIPSHYRSKTIKKITYLSDFEHLESELGKLKYLSEIINSDLVVLHFFSLVMEKSHFESVQNIFNLKENETIELRIQKGNIELSLVEKISRYITKNKPDLLVMFSKREKGFFESIFLPSKSAELTFSTKVPVLIFPK